MTNAPILPSIDSTEPVLSQLRNLSLSPSPSTPQSGPLITKLKAINRASNASATAHRERTAEARNSIGVTSLGLQNLMYERRHLEREIEKCRQFAFVYQDVPLHSVEEFVRLAPDELKTEEVLTDDHQLMLNMLTFELEERKRLEARRKELVSERDAILADSKSFQTEVDKLADPFQKLAEMTAKVQRMIHEIAPSPPKTPEPEPEVMQEDDTGSRGSQEVQDSLELGADEGHDTQPSEQEHHTPLADAAMDDVD